MATSYNINTIQGDNLQIALSVKDQYNNPINLSGYDVRGVVKYAYFGSPTPLDVSGDFLLNFSLKKFLLGFHHLVKLGLLVIARSPVV